MGVSHSAIVFAGPSLRPADLEAYPAVTWREPVARGDILRAIRLKPAVIGIIDGYFAERPSVLHKEILEALSVGIHVYGAASMGALRAAELDTFGMVGVGRIYKRYASGELISDAAVAVVHGPAALGFPPLSIAEVDVAATARSLVDRQHLTPQQATRIRRAAAQIHFSERTWDRVAAAASRDEQSAKPLAALLASAHVRREAP